MLYKQFYSELGKLLYAIADIDGIISKKEKEKLKELVREKLIPAEKHKDEFGTFAAYYTEFEFDVMEEAIIEPQAAFESFINFIDDHQTAIDKELITVTRKVAETLAEAYYLTSKKEKQLLTVLNAKLDILEEKKK